MKLVTLYELTSRCVPCTGNVVEVQQYPMEDIERVINTDEFIIGKEVKKIQYPVRLYRKTGSEDFYAAWDSGIQELLNLEMVNTDELYRLRNRVDYLEDSKKEFENLSWKGYAKLAWKKFWKGRIKNVY